MPCIESDSAIRSLQQRATLGAFACLLALLLAACAPTRPPSMPPAVPTAPAASPVQKPPAKPAEPLARDWREYHRIAAQRLVSANPDRSYMGPVPEPLKGIPILEVELNGDGSVRQIKVQRRPRPADAQHTTQLAIEAVKRAAPFPPVAHLPKPWAYTEVFLFNDSDRFKPRTLDD